MQICAVNEEGNLEAECFQQRLSFEKQVEGMGNGRTATHQTAAGPAPGGGSPFATALANRLEYPLHWSSGPGVGITGSGALALWLPPAGSGPTIRWPEVVLWNQGCVPLDKVLNLSGLVRLCSASA